MPVATYCALLRGINVSGKNMIKMDRLRASCEAAGLEDVRTYLQSGNIVFRSMKKAAALEALLHQKITEDFDCQVPITVLTAAELGETVADNPFLKEKGIDPLTLHVTFLSGKPAAAALQKLAAVPAAPDRFRSVGRRIYLHCPEGYGRTKLSNQAIERILAITATTRNWKTVNELVRMME